MVAYLEAYALEFGVAPRFNEEVKWIRRDGEMWRVETSNGTHRAKSVVVATGFTSVPNVPEWPGLDRFGGPVLHSSAYQNGAPFRGRDVLVIGLGNSGGEIAIDLCEHGARTAVAVRSPVNVIPRELLGVPVLAIGAVLRPLPTQVADTIGSLLIHLAIGDIEKLGLRRLPYGPMTQIARDQRIPLIDV
ncbi:MAG TPA: NAD(P)/FAD-dependent oxidoreductase, partial [Myxococcaceae bacterium]|nr:NAD(P)/FAD-dependent oxidoreductase [Myxococcaceae bacterium]